jgi:Fic family protein
MPKDNPTNSARPDWPAVGYEEHPWHIEDTFSLSNSKRATMRGPYKAAVPARISALTPDLSSSTIAACEDAATAIARFDATYAVVNPPLASVLLRTESVASSQIENLSASAKQLALAELGAAKSQNAQLVYANVKAMRAAVELAENLDGPAIIEMQRVLLQESNPRIVGAWRSQQVWIGSSALSPHTALFVPPHHARIQELIDDLALFMRRTDLPQIAQIAIAHAQFETIHPFEDGNGRTGRAIVQAMLRASGLADQSTVPLSAGILGRQSEYFAALDKFHDGNVQPIIDVFVNATFAAIDNGKALNDQLEQLLSGWQSALKARRDSTAHKLLALLPGLPVVNIPALVQMLDVTDMTAMAAVDKLVEVGALRASSQSSRNRTWQSDAVLEALDEFAARSLRKRI